MSKALVVRCFAALAFAALIAVSAHSQATASLRGIVTDPTGAVIPEATVTIKSLENGSSRKTASDINGEYSFLEVAPGDYTLLAEKSGFATITNGLPNTRMVGYPQIAEEDRWGLAYYVLAFRPKKK